MKFEMQAVIVPASGEEYRWPDWDYFFFASSIEEAEEKARDYREAFESHGQDGCRILEGPLAVGKP